MRILLIHGSARVSKKPSKELLEALNKMSELAFKRASENLNKSKKL